MAEIGSRRGQEVLRGVCLTNRYTTVHEPPIHATVLHRH